MLLDIREREREAQANRLAQAVAGRGRPGPAVIPDPRPPAFHALADILGQAFRPVEPEAPRPAAQIPVFNDDGNFEWIDNPSM
jgi:hypothetical protein